MKVYVTTKNTGPSYSSDPKYCLYLGTSLELAEEVVRDFRRYEKNEEDYPTAFPNEYTILPRHQHIDWAFTKFYHADGWWYSIVEFELD